MPAPTGLSNFDGSVTAADRESFLRDIAPQGVRTPLAGVRGSFDKFATSTATLRRIAVYGDSLSAGHIDANNVAWPNYLRRMLRNKGYTVHTGICPVYRTSSSDPTGYWSFAGTWASDADSICLPFPSSARSAAGSSANIATWTKPAGETVTAFHIVWVDAAATGASAFSYSIDGGAWVDVAMTKPTTPALRRTEVVASVTSTVRVRAANAAGTAVAVPALFAIEARGGNTGLVIDNLSLGGQAFSDMLVTGTPNWSAWFTAAGANLILVGLGLNDIATEDIAVDTELIQGRLGSVGVLSLFGYDSGLLAPPRVGEALNRTLNKQVELHDVLADYAEDNNLPLCDLWARFDGASGTSYEDDFALDTVHPTANGNRAIAGAVFDMLRL
jgi:lysophospholipase L1-like esterase